VSRCGARWRIRKRPSRHNLSRARASPCRPSTVSYNVKNHPLLTCFHRCWFPLAFTRIKVETARSVAWKNNKARVGLLAEDATNITGTYLDSPLAGGVQYREHYYELPSRCAQRRIKRQRSSASTQCWMKTRARRAMRARRILGSGMRTGDDAVGGG